MQHVEPLFDFIFRRSGFQIVQQRVRLEYGVGYGGFDFMGNHADKLFLPIDEIVVFEGFLIHLAV